MADSVLLYDGTSGSLCIKKGERVRSLYLSRHYCSVAFLHLYRNGSQGAKHVGNMGIGKVHTKVPTLQTEGCWRKGRKAGYAVMHLYQVVGADESAI